MAEALFYHLTESRLEDALPPLLEKSLERGWKVSVHVGSEERRDALAHSATPIRSSSSPSSPSFCFPFAEGIRTEQKENITPEQGEGSWSQSSSSSTLQAACSDH